MTRGSIAFALAVVIGLAFAPRTARASCSFSATSPVAFNSYNPLSTSATPGQGSFTYKCTAITGITIDIDGGLRGNRTMSRNLGGTDVLLYALYQDPLYAVPWGSTALTHMIIVVAPLVNTTLTIYGLLPKQQDVQTGDYGDTIKVTINF